MEGPVIYEYTRKQAIEGGVLIDVTDLAREAGFKYPVAVTAAVWGEYVAVPDACPWQDQNGRLWDLLWMFLYAIKRGADGEVTSTGLL